MHSNSQGFLQLPKQEHHFQDWWEQQLSRLPSFRNMVSAGRSGYHCSPIMRGAPHFSSSIRFYDVIHVFLISNYSCHVYEDRELNMQATEPEPWSSMGRSFPSQRAVIYQDASNWRRRRWDLAGARQQRATRLEGGRLLWFRSSSELIIIANKMSLL